MMQAFKVIVLLTFMTFKIGECDRSKLNNSVPKITTERIPEVSSLNCGYSNKDCGIYSNRRSDQSLWIGHLLFPKAVKKPSEPEQRPPIRPIPHTTTSASSISSVDYSAPTTSTTTPFPRIITYDDNNKYCGKFQINVNSYGVWAGRYRFLNATKIFAEHLRRPRKYRFSQPWRPSVY